MRLVMVSGSRRWVRRSVRTEGMLPSGSIRERRRPCRSVGRESGCLADHELGERPVVLGAGGPGGEGGDGLVRGGGFGEGDVLADVEDGDLGQVGGREGAHLASDRRALAGAPVEAADGEGGDRDGLADAGEALGLGEDLGETLETEVARFDREDHAVGGEHGDARQVAGLGRGVDEHEVGRRGVGGRGALIAFEGAAEDPVGARLAGEAAGAVLEGVVGREQVDAVAGGEEGVADGQVAVEHPVGAVAEVLERRRRVRRPANRWSSPGGRDR